MKKYISIMFVIAILVMTASCGESSVYHQSPNADSEYSYKSKYAKINCPEVPYYGFTDPLETLLYEDYDTAVKRNEANMNEANMDDEQYLFIGYRYYKDGVELTSLFGTGDFPEQINGKPVVKLGGRLDFDAESERIDTYFNCYDKSFVSKITIPSGVQEIVFNTFESLTELEQINVSPDNPYYSSVDGILYNKDKTVLLCIPLNHKSKTINIPKTVKTAYSLFSNNTVTVNVPPSVEKLSSALNAVGEYRNSVYNLEELSIDSKLKKINVDKNNKAYSSLNGVLYNKKQTKLLVYPRLSDEKMLKISDTVKTIDNIYIDYHNKLKEIIFGRNIKKIGFRSDPAGYSDKLIVRGYKNTPVQKWIKSLDCWDNNVKFIALD